MSRPKAYWNITTAMLRCGLLGYGGGPSTIPLFRHEAVTKFEWISDEDFGEILAIANTLPGPIATKMAAYLGYRVKGWLGAVLAVLVLIGPTSLAMIALFSALTWFSHSPIVQGIIAAVGPVVAVMLGVLAYQFAKKTWKGLGKWLGIAFGVIAFVLLMVLHWSSGIVVILFLLYGMVHFRVLERIKGAQSRRKGSDGSSGDSADKSMKG